MYLTLKIRIYLNLIPSKDKLLDTYLLVKRDEVLKKYTEDLIKSYDVSLSKKYSFE